MTIKVYENVQDMTGHGEEWLVKGEQVLAVFIDGNLRCEVISINSLDEITKKTA